jgi:hypothetical protein
MMSEKRFTFTLEPEDSLYRQLLDFALSAAQFALLVIRSSLALHSSAEQVLAKLEPFLQEKEISSKWPGTTLHDAAASVFRYQFDPACAAVLKETAPSLYSWRQPELPEDLCLLRADRTPWLVSIAHEADGYLCLSEDEIKRLLKTLPQLKNIIRLDSTAS